METYTLNTANPVEPRIGTWTLTVRSDPSSKFYYLLMGLVAGTDFCLPLDTLSEGHVLPRPRSYAGPLEELYSFDALPDLDALAEAQGVSPTTDVRSLATDGWPENESVEDFIAAAMEGRHEEDEPDS